MKSLEELDYRLISLLSAEQAHAFGVVPIERTGKTLKLLAGEEDKSQTAKLSILLNADIHLKIIEKETLRRYLLKYYPQTAKVNSQKAVISSESSSDIVRFVQKVFEEAAGMGASDIHIERYEDEARIRFRWEGQLIEKYQVPLTQYKAIISRIKILADLDIAEQRLPQDGRIQQSYGESKIDVRVSTIPGKYGEKAVLRLLTRDSAQLALGNLGMTEAEERVYRQIIQKPNGLILITGPTGSGKTTTLYASLNLLNKADKNIITIEDPIEYNIKGINQVQLKEEIGLSFDSALRSFLRQDPDIIMVGEIRDKPTAQIAIRSALTGHLVFSTLHTNSAADAITRLSDMGVQPYLIAASLRLVVAQRLLRMLCPKCKKPSSETLFPEIQTRWKIKAHYLPDGCPNCFYTGYLGRKAVFEFLPLSKDIEVSIKSGHEIPENHLSDSGLTRLNENIAALVLSGRTSLQEAAFHIDS